MATESEVINVLATLAGARLRNAPAKDEAPAVKNTWLRVMRDIPGSVLQTAADDSVLDSEFWPTPAEIRRRAVAINSRNGRRGEDAFRRSGARIPREWFRLSTAYWSEHDRLVMACAGGALPTDAELYHLEELSGRIEP